jgi:hypothetical protein
MDAESLATLISAMSQKKTVKMLDVSHNPLKKAGVLELAKFLHVDTKLQVLIAQRIETAAIKSDEMLQFAKAIEINVTLAKLDFRGNQLHGAIATQLKRTMEEKRKMLPLPMDAKVCFLLCNQRLPFGRRLPLVAQTAAHDGSAGPILLIFKFCGQVRELLLDPEFSDSAELDLERMRERLRDYIMSEGAMGEDQIADFLEWNASDVRVARQTMIRCGLLDREAASASEGGSSEDAHMWRNNGSSDDDMDF